MAGDSQHKIMMRRIHQVDICAQRLPKGGDFGDLVGIGPFGRREDAPAIVKQGGKARLWPAAFRPGDGVGGDDSMAGQRLGEGGQNAGLGRADIADDRTRRDMIANLCGDSAHRADRHTQDDEIRAHHGLARCLGNAACKGKLARRCPCCRVGVIAGHSHIRQAFCNSTGNGGADQAQPDNGDMARKCCGGH